MKKMIAYCRTSSEKGELKISIEYQEKKILEYAEKNNIEIIKVFKERDTSGKLYWTGAEPDNAVKDLLINWDGEKSRKVFAEVIQMIDLRQVDGLICHEPTRLCRPIQHSRLQQDIIDIFRERNNKKAVEIHFVGSGEFDYSDPMNLNIFTFMQSMHSTNLDYQQDKSKATLQERRDKGLKDRSVECLGIRDGRLSQTIEIIKNELDIVKEIYALFDQNYSYSQIAEQMTKKGYKSTRYGKKITHKKNNKTSTYGNNWTTTNIIKILKNPYYIGYRWQYSDKRMKQLLTKDPTTINTLKPFTLMEEVVDYLKISRYTFEHNQKIINKRSSSRAKSKKHDNLYTGIIICGACQQQMWAHHASVPYNGLKHQYTSFICKNKDCDTADRQSVRLNNSEKIKLNDNLFCQGLEQALEPLLLIQLVNDLKLNKNKPELQNQLFEINSEFKKIESQISYCVRSELRDDIKDQEITRFNEELDELDFQKQQLENQLNKVEVPTRELYQYYKKNKRSTIIDTFKKILVYSDHVDIFLNSNKSFSLPSYHKRNAKFFPKAYISFSQKGQDNYLSKLFYDWNEKSANNNLANIISNDFVNKRFNKKPMDLDFPNAEIKTNSVLTHIPLNELYVKIRYHYQAVYNGHILFSPLNPEEVNNKLQISTEKEVIIFNDQDLQITTIGEEADKIPHSGKLWTIYELSKLTGVKPTTIEERIQKGHSIEQLFNPPKPKRRRSFTQKEIAYIKRELKNKRTIISLAEEFNCDRRTISALKKKYLK